MATILVVDDEMGIRELLSEILSDEGHVVEAAENAQAAREYRLNQAPDLVLLDWMLPGKSGIAFARDLRNNERTKHIPIIMLTARGDEQDKVLGLEIGADDYVTKPIEPRVLVARARALLRRAQPAAADTPVAAPEALVFGELAISPPNRTVTWRGEPVDLKTAEFNLLLILARAAGTVL
ncbi:response regulator transcription factor, partial [Ralstonia pickettii]|nr:response regulator transcription factor [Ralstonia pickettii]